MPQLHEEVEFNPDAVARKLGEGLSASGNSAKADAVISLLARRPSYERAAVAASFGVVYGRQLRQELKRHFGGDFYRVCKLLTYYLSEHDAKCLRYAIKGAGTDEQVLIDILTTRNNHQIKAIKYAYATLLKRDLVNDVKSDVSGHFGDVLLRLLRADRDENPAVDDREVRADVEILFRAGEAIIGTDETPFNEILCSRSLEHLAAVSRQYCMTHGSTLDQVIHSETSGSYRNLLLSIISYALNPTAHVANQFYTSVKGLGTHDKRLQRTVIGFCEAGLSEVKEAYVKLDGRTLAEAIRSNTSGHYRRVLLVLIGEE